MSRGTQSFRQRDVTKAIKAAVKAGVKDWRIEIAEGKIIVVAAEPASTPDADNEPLRTLGSSYEPPRSALPLPRYVERKPIKGGWAHFFHVPTWAKRAGCPLHNEALGLDYDAAVKRAEEVLLPSFDAWRSGGDTKTATTPAIAAIGTLDWVFSEYRADRRYTKLGPKSKRNHEVGFRLVGGYILKGGKRLGEKRATAIDTALVDDLYEKLLILKTTDADGKVVERERRTTVNHAMKSCRRAWKVCARRNPSKLPPVNPFAQMGLQSSDRETPTATYEELVAFRVKAVELGLPSLATAALIGWEWLQRETDIFATFDVSHYRSKQYSNMVRVVDEKTKRKSWIPPFDDAGAPLYPELMAELDAIKLSRIGGLMLCRATSRNMRIRSQSIDFNFRTINRRQFSLMCRL